MLDRRAEIDPLPPDGGAPPPIGEPLHMNAGPGVAWGASSLFALSVFAATPVRALDLDDQGGLITSTIAGQERLKDYDNAKRYGAERVSDRDRQESKPDGLRAGNYIMYPSAGALVVFDDNIFKSDANKVSDVRSELTPQVKLLSQLPRHVLDLSLSGKIVNYLENDDQNYINLRANAEGALHFDHAHTLSASVLSAIEHEERGVITAPRSAATPVQVFHNRAAVGITRDVGRLYGTVAAMAEQWDYSDVRALDGAQLDQDARDTTVVSAQLRAGYRFSPGFDIIGKVRGLRSYNRGDAITDRDATGFEAMGGIAFQTNPLLRWRVLGGYGLRDFDQAGLETAKSLQFEGQMQWLATQRLTIYATATRRIEETTGPEGLGRIETVLAGRAEFELLHNLLLTTDLKFADAEFLGFTRQDRTWSARLGLDYFHTKNWLFTIGYEYQTRDSTEAAFDMTGHRIMLGSKLSF